jgi:diguanylate cyclase (GGDEF)-like protein
MPNNSKYPDGDRPATGPAASPIDFEGDVRTLSDRDQITADGDQTGSDLDQTTSDADQSASERDQLASDRDQEAADSDQAVSDGRNAPGEYSEDYARSRRARSQSALERDEASQARSETARFRDDAAGRRDRFAEERDSAAQARDQLAARLDAELERLEADSQGTNGERVTGLEVLLHAASHRKRATVSRARAAAQRESAARDREQAALDRQQAALDRAIAAEELALEGFDHVTGALRRRVGLAAIQRELDRTARSGEALVVAFVDVNGLKAVNDELGHGTGDELLRETVDAIKKRLRSYDVITRIGGDEFVCSLSAQDAAGARNRFVEISSQLAAGPTCASFTVGLVERRKDDSVDDLIHRADEEMRQTRRSARNGAAGRGQDEERS